MSEREFETYLSLLCRLLRLDSKQRETIARELRDHLEERLAELQLHGVARDKAVRLALEEFGDAAGLAAEFSSIARNVRRRWLMRMTLGSTIAAAAVMMAVVALWPDSKQPGPAPRAAVAQEAAVPAHNEAAPDNKSGARVSDYAGPAVPPLDRRLNAGFNEAPLREVIDYLRGALGGQFYINEKRLAAEEISLDTPVTLRLDHVRADMLLDLALKQADDRLAYLVRDGLVIISDLRDLEGAAEVRVYNVRDLLKLPPATYTGSMMGMMGPGGEGMGGYGGGYGPGMAMGMGDMAMPAVSNEDRAEMLMQVIKGAVGQQHWDPQRHSSGTIVSYDGLLVVNHNSRVHQQVERVLAMLRTAAAKKDPKEGYPPSPPAAEERNDAATRASLEQEIKAEFLETPLVDVLEHLSDSLGVQVYVNWKQMETAEAAKDTPISLELSQIRGALALELALDQAGANLAYVIRDGVVIVSTADDLDGAAMLRVYNCRDLLAQRQTHEGASAATPGYGADYGGGWAMMGSYAGPGGMGESSPAGPPVSSSAASRLVNILTASVAWASWQSAGGTGTIAEYNGLIVVNHNARVHTQIERVLKMVRQAGAVEEASKAEETP